MTIISCLSGDNLKNVVFSTFGNLCFLLFAISFANFCQRPLLSLYDFGPPQLICLTQSFVLFIVVHSLGFRKIINYGNFNIREFGIMLLPAVFLGLNRMILLVGLKDSQVTSLLCVGQLTPLFIILFQMLICEEFSQKRTLFVSFILFLGGLLAVIGNFSYDEWTYIFGAIMAFSETFFLVSLKYFCSRYNIVWGAAARYISIILLLSFGVFCIVKQPTEDLSLGDTLETVFTLTLTAATHTLSWLLIIFYTTAIGNEFCGLSLSVYRAISILMGIGFYGGIAINNLTSTGLTLQVLSLIALIWIHCSNNKNKQIHG